jgi:predicted transcriptional regulator
VTDDSIDLTSTNEMLGLAADIVTAYVSNNSITSSELPEVIKTVYTTLNHLDKDKHAATLSKPAVPIKKSYTNDYIICLEDGKRLKMMKRYLRTRYGLSPEEYRAKWGLPSDYPMVAPNYAAKRSEFAKKIGLLL